MSINFHLLSIDSEIAFQLKNSTLDIETFLYTDDGDERSLDIGKSWQIIHFVLTGEEAGGDTILSNVIMGGEGIGSELGYGLVEPENVKEIAEELEEATEEKFIEIFRKRDFSNVTLYAFNPEELEQEISYVLPYFSRVREYYLSAARHNKFMLLYSN
jgi:Domain of unknown function (DUF1877)